MFKYFKFSWKFLTSYYSHPSFTDRGYFPFKCPPGTVVKLLCGGQFKYEEKYVVSPLDGKWVLFESTEDVVKKTQEYKDTQEKILQDLRQLKEEFNEDHDKLPKYLN